MSGGWRFWIDRGGTFTDIVARLPDGSLRTDKRLSDDPDDAALTGIRHLLGLPPDAPIPPERIDSVRMGTTVATNALLERRGARTLLLVNTGFADLLRIGDQARPRLFDLAITRPPQLYDRVAELTCRHAEDGSERAPLDEPAATAVLNAAAADGIRACAIALIHAWRHPAHERRLADLARAAGFTQVSTSHAVSPLIRLIPRAGTTVLDAYLSPVLHTHVTQLARALPATRLFFMQSHGGLTSAADFAGRDAVLSGPAGGIVGAARTAAAAGVDKIIGFDMGGTSTDVALYAGAYERSFDTEIAGIRLRAPMLAIHTVAAGGGSRLHFDGARMQVGPDSAGARPGPAGYGQGGPLTITDANILLGRLQPDHFPAIFGRSGTARLDTAAVTAAVTTLTNEIAAATGTERTPHHIAAGYLRIAVANMANAIRQISIQKGHDVTAFALHCFGGAGAQHACLVADDLGMTTVLIHPLAGLLSAYGMGLADRSTIRTRSVERMLEPALMPDLHSLAAELAQAAAATLQAATGDAIGDATLIAPSLHLRHAGTEGALIIPLADLAAMRTGFAAAHQTRFGFTTPDRPIVVEAVSVEATLPGAALVTQDDPPAEPAPAAAETIAFWTDGALRPASVHARARLRPSDRIAGPAMITDPHTTIVVDAGWTARRTPDGMLILTRDAPPAATRDTAPAATPDPANLEVFANQFMAIAEQMGAVLRNVAQSVNIRERLDFSCAIFDDEGALIANAPHVPVHLGAMGESVRSVLRHRRTALRPGDVIALNNPYDGGTHLPDITVITPVFDTTRTLRCFVASRGHHADIGGTTPGSTPAFSRRLADEGVIIDNFLLVRNDEFRESELRALLADSRFPARNPDTNVADLRAQIAANAAGAHALQSLIGRHGWPMISAYMAHVMDNAADCVRRIIDTLHDATFDYRMDDGARLAVAIRVDRAGRSATIDFTGTDPQRDGNFNAPPAVIRAVVLYVFRCLVARDIPLNDGCLRPLTLVIPAGSFLNPHPGAAVVAGNTEVSQAVCAALFGALGVLASSQATMNNLLFGDATRQYYETICGGGGGGAEADGADAVHTHMTNTRMTDPEIMESRYPIRVEQFSIRPDSGGTGRHAGGNGAIRRLRFLAPMTAVIVASRRTQPPFGLHGGGNGAPGTQWIEHPDGTRTELAGIAEFAVQPGDILTVATPGGGGYGGVKEGRGSAPHPAGGERPQTRIR